jgi:multicomponent Na+:H+ antiporter subunit F
VALLLVLAEAQKAPALRDVALTLAVLAILACVAFVTRMVRADVDEQEGDGDERD